jgi:hypothetical protein
VTQEPLPVISNKQHQNPNPPLVAQKNRKKLQQSSSTAKYMNAGFSFRAEQGSDMNQPTHSTKHLLLIFEHNSFL